MALLTRSVIMFVIFTFFAVMIFYTLKFVQQKRKYRLGTSQGFLDGISIPLLLPGKKTVRYQKLRGRLLEAGWTVSVERFYLIKYVLIIAVLGVTLGVYTTNNNLAISNLKSDLNFGRGIMDNRLQADAQAQMEEESLLAEVEGYLASQNLKPTDEIAKTSVEAFLNDRGITYDSAQAAAVRITSKLTALDGLESGYLDLLALLVMALASGYVPNLLMVIKLLLIKNNRDWDILHCLTTYSVMGRLPPYRLDELISSMQAVGRIYARPLGVFKEALTRNDTQEQDKLMNATDDDDLLQIYETLALAAEIGVNKTVENVDDMIDTKLKWLEVNARKSRDKKFMITYIPVAIVLLSIFLYAMQGMNVLNQMLLSGTSF